MNDPTTNRKNRVDYLFRTIEIIANRHENNKIIRDKLIKPLAEELWAISKIQLASGELDHLHKGE